MIKLALIIERANINLGGAERSILELTQALSNLGADVTLLAATGKSQDVNVKVLCDNNNKRTSLDTFAGAIKQHLKTYDYDIVHSTLPMDFADIYQPRGGTYPETIIRNAKSYTNPVASLVKRNAHFLNLRRTRLLMAERNICKKHNGPIIAALSKYVKTQFTKHYHLTENRIELIPNAVCLPQQTNLQELDKIKNRIYSDLNVDSDTPGAVFLFAANNYRLKGLMPLLRAVKIAKDTYKNKKVCLAIAGGDKHQLDYEKVALKLGIIGNVIFLNAIKDVFTTLQACDVAVLPTYYDPCSRFILEALAANKPVITTKYNGAADFYQNQRHGAIISKPNDSKALAEAMIFYAQKNNAHQASNAIIEDRLADNISIKRHGQQLIQLYEKIIESKQKK